MYRTIQKSTAHKSDIKVGALLIIKGAGGVDDPGKVEIEFTVVPDRGECQLPDTFYQIKKYCS